MAVSRNSFCYISRHHGSMICSENSTPRSRDCFPGFLVSADADGCHGGLNLHLVGMRAGTVHVQQEMQPLHSRKHKNSFFKRHGLSVIATGVLLLWVVLLYGEQRSEPLGIVLWQCHRRLERSRGDDIGDQASL